MQTIIGRKIKIVKNIEDHRGYVKDQVLTIKTEEPNSYITVIEGNWYIGLEEIEFI